MTARNLVDRAVESRLFVLDLGEDQSYLEVEVPRLTTWYFPSGKRMAPELIALNQALCDKKPAAITETLSRSDHAELKRLIKAELEKYEKKDEKRDLTFARNVLVSFVKSLYTRRGNWAADLSGAKTS